MTHSLPLSIVALVVGILISANIPVSRSHLDGNSNVKGVEISQKTPPKISSDSGKNAFINNNDGAISTFPLKVDKATGTLTVTTPKGEKVVTVLPDAAISNMLASKVMSYVTSVPTSGELASTSRLVKLVEKDRALVYEIDGIREHKLFGFIPLKSKVKVYVSAENGQVVKTETSLFGRILNRIAP